jgi:hypothetical protein
MSLIGVLLVACGCGNLRIPHRPSIAFFPESGVAPLFLLLACDGGICVHFCHSVCVWHRKAVGLKLLQISSSDAVLTQYSIRWTTRSWEAWPTRYVPLLNAPSTLPPILAPRLSACDTRWRVIRDGSTSRLLWIRPPFTTGRGHAHLCILYKSYTCLVFCSRALLIRFLTLALQRSEGKHICRRWAGVVSSGLFNFHVDHLTCRARPCAWISSKRQPG